MPLFLWYLNNVTSDFLAFRKVFIDLVIGRGIQDCLEIAAGQFDLVSAIACDGEIHSHIGAVKEIDK